MIVGSEKILETAQKVLERIDDKGDLGEVDEVFVIVAVHYGSLDFNNEEELNEIYYRCTSARLFVQHGLLEATHRAIDNVVKEENDD